MVAALLVANAALLWLGLTTDAVTIGITVKKEFLGFAFRLADERATYSILGAIWKLKSDGNVALFVLVVVFSVVFPIAKLVGGMWLWSMATFGASSGTGAARLRVWAERLSGLGKWSMLEVFMAALLCALLKAGDMVRVVIQPGMYWFVTAVIVSIVTANLTKRYVGGIAYVGTARTSH